VDVLQEGEATGVTKVVAAGVACRDQEIAEAGGLRRSTPGQELEEHVVTRILGGRPVYGQIEGQAQHGPMVPAIERFDGTVVPRVVR